MRQGVTVCVFEIYGIRNVLGEGEDGVMTVHHTPLRSILMECSPIIIHRGSTIAHYYIGSCVVNKLTLDRLHVRVCTFCSQVYYYLVHQSSRENLIRSLPGHGFWLL